MFPNKESLANLFLTECDFSASKPVDLIPLVLYDKHGNYEPEAQEIFAGRINAAFT